MQGSQHSQRSRVGRGMTTAPHFVQQPDSSSAGGASPAPYVFEPLIDSETTAKMLGGMHPKTLERKAREGAIPGHQIFGSWYFRASELDEWLSSNVRSNQANNTRVN